MANDGKTGGSRDGARGSRDGARGSRGNGARGSRDGSRGSHDGARGGNGRGGSRRRNDGGGKKTRTLASVNEEELKAALEGAAEGHAPAFLRAMLEEAYGDQHQRVLDGYVAAAQRRTTMRANTLVATREEVEAALDEQGLAHEPVSWYDDALMLETGIERTVWDMFLYEQGGMYLQSLSSMLPPLYLDVKPGQDILDMCAAPGGKTCEIAALGQGKAHITACEMSVPRAEKLEFNLKRQHVVGVSVMRTDARMLDDFFSFDRILLDAPCSGTGTVRDGDPRSTKHLTPMLVDRCCRSQRILLTKALSLVKPGGVVVYSTCSVLPSENEDMVRECLKAAAKHGVYQVEAIEAPEGAPLLPNTLEGTFTVCPSELYEGFFVARIKRLS